MLTLEIRGFKGNEEKMLLSLGLCVEDDFWDYFSNYASYKVLLPWTIPS